MIRKIKLFLKIFKLIFVVIYRFLDFIISYFVHKLKIKLFGGLK